MIHVELKFYPFIVDYLVIAPWENGKKIKIEDLNIPHWNLSNDQPNSRSLEMGHRGCGSTNGQKRYACFHFLSFLSLHGPLYTRSFNV